MTCAFRQVARAGQVLTWVLWWGYVGVVGCLAPQARPEGFLVLEVVIDGPGRPPDPGGNLLDRWGEVPVGVEAERPNIASITASRVRCPRATRPSSAASVMLVRR